MNKIVVSITGHRLLSSDQKAKVEPVLKKAIQNIMFVLNEQGGQNHYLALTPIAEGADTMFAHAARSLGIPLHILLPFERSVYLKGFSSDLARNEFDMIYNDVADDQRTTLSPLKTNELDILGDDGFNQLFMDVGRKVVDDADYIIAIWNEKQAKGKGGTGDVVAYAMEKGKNVLIINPEDTHPYIDYITPDTYHPDRVRAVFDPHETNHVSTFIDEKQKVYDTHAMIHNKIYRRTWTVGFVIGLVEVFAFAIIISFHVPLAVHYVLASIEFYCIVSIVLLVLFGRTAKHHRNYVHYRIVSERLRIKNYFARLGLRIYETVISPIYASLKEKPEYNILDTTIRLINLSAYSYLSFEKKKHYLETELITDQYKYHERKKEKYERKNSLYKKVRGMLILLFLCAVSLHYINVSNEFFLEQGFHLSSYYPDFFHHELFEDIIIFISIFIPATIAACEALKYVYEWEKIINLSAAMAAYFRAKSVELKDTHTEEDLELFLNGINKDMLIENLDWEKYMQDKQEMPT